MNKAYSITTACNYFFPFRCEVDGALAAVDCTEEKLTCTEYEVKGYPTCEYTPNENKQTNKQTNQPFLLLVGRGFN